jgi:mono/diheme cytochrome c family protein
MKNFLMLLVPALLLFVATGCYYDNEEELYANYKNPPADITGGNDTITPPPPEDTTICFQDQIMPIFSSNCNMAGCHDGSNSEAQQLTSYAYIMNDIVAYNPSQSDIYRAITGTGGDPMPPTGSLTPAQINLIYRWINQGAQNTTNCANSCDTSNVTWSGIVSSIITNNCVGCHGAGAGNGVNLSSHSSIKTFLDVAANNTRFLNSVNYTSTKPMPPSGKMSVCKVRQVDIWVNAGYLNNK